VSDQPTRSFGLLEGLLARRRASRAESLIPDALRSHRILDLGCGTTPYFLQTTRFRDRVGMDPALASTHSRSGLLLVRRDTEVIPWPFPDAHFSVVTMLAVLEHLRPERVTEVLCEARRVLRPSGALVLTCPAAWTAPILKAMAKLRLLSPEEISDHKGAYGIGDIRRLLEAAGFDPPAIRCGRFQFGVNSWAIARR